MKFFHNHSRLLLIQPLPQFELKTGNCGDFINNPVRLVAQLAESTAIQTPCPVAR